MLLRAGLHRLVQRQLHSERNCRFLASEVLLQTGNTVIVVGVVKQFGGVHIHCNLLAAVVFQLNKLHRLRSRPSAFSADRWRPLVERSA